MSAPDAGGTDRLRLKGNKCKSRTLSKVLNELSVNIKLKKYNGSLIKIHVLQHSSTNTLDTIEEYAKTKSYGFESTRFYETKSSQT